MWAGNLSFKHSNRLSVSTELCPRSTKSPKNMYDVSGGQPPTPSKIFNKSKNCPCKSPTIVTGLVTGWTLDSSISSSPTSWQSCRSSRSETGSPSLRVAIQASTSSPMFSFISFSFSSSFSYLRATLLRPALLYFLLLSLFLPLFSSEVRIEFTCTVLRLDELVMKRIFQFIAGIGGA